MAWQRLADVSTCPDARSDKLSHAQMSGGAETWRQTARYLVTNQDAVLRTAIVEEAFLATKLPRGSTQRQIGTVQRRSMFNPCVFQVVHSHHGS